VLNLIAATHVEAEPIIAALKLKKTSARLPYFKSKTTTLVVSGIGKCRAAAACAWLAAKISEEPIEEQQSWINFGIAGHSDASTGTVLAAHKVRDYASEKVWFPPRIKAPLPSSDLVTVDKPLKEYLPGQLHDMEASGFIDTARLFCDAELVQTVKVVSDNEKQPFSNISTQLSRDLIADNSPTIIEFTEHLRELASHLGIVDIGVREEFVSRWQFSTAQTVQLERLLQRYNVIFPTMQKIPQDFSQLNTANQVLNQLKQTVDSADTFYD